MKIQILQWSLIVALGVAAPMILAANTDQHKHHQQPSKKTMGSKMDHKQHQAMRSGGMKVLSWVPDSGKAREAGFDGRYAMESTTMPSKMANRCALASRGIIMLDNRSWKSCGGKPKGASPGSKKARKAAHQHH